MLYIFITKFLLTLSKFYLSNLSAPVGNELIGIFVKIISSSSAYPVFPSYFFKIALPYAPYLPSLPSATVLASLNFNIVLITYFYN